MGAGEVIMSRGKGKALQLVERMFENVQIVFVEPDKFDKERIAKIYRMPLQDQPDSRNNARAVKDVARELDYQI